MLLKDKVAVITGGAGQNGLGFATARMMAEQGARVVILDLAVADPQAAAARLGAQHLGLAVGLEADPPRDPVLVQEGQHVVAEFPFPGRGIDLDPVVKLEQSLGPRALPDDGVEGREQRVEPEQRGRGVGRAAMRLAEEGFPRRR